MGINERFCELLKRKNISVKEAANIIGKSDMYVRKLMRTGESFGIEPAMAILNSMKDVSADWLLTGKGSMLKSSTAQKDEVKAVKPENDDEIKYVRLLPLHAHGGSLNDFTVSVKDSDCEKVLSPVKGADFAIQVQGDSMAPEYPSGSVILIKKINESAFIEWGKAYVLDTENGSVVKKVVPSDKEGFVRCVSINPDPSYAPFDVPLSSVYGIYRVLMCMSMK